MTRLEHLLTIVSEECNEVAQRASKALRFGIHEVQPGQTANNLERLRLELADLFAIIEMVEDETGFELYGGTGSEIEAKKKKVEKFLELSRKEGTLQ